jgi:hypothetical protein
MYTFIKATVPRGAVARIKKISLDVDLGNANLAAAPKRVYKRALLVPLWSRLAPELPPRGLVATSFAYSSSRGRILADGTRCRL